MASPRLIVPRLRPNTKRHKRRGKPRLWSGIAWTYKDTAAWLAELPTNNKTWWRFVITLQINTHTIIPILPYSNTSILYPSGFGELPGKMRFCFWSVCAQTSCGSTGCPGKSQDPCSSFRAMPCKCYNFHPASSGSGQASSLCLTALYRELTCSNT